MFLFTLCVDVVGLKYRSVVYDEDREFVLAVILSDSLKYDSPNVTNLILAV